MPRTTFWSILGFAAALLFSAQSAGAAYHHMGELDSGVFVAQYPSAAGTKLDSCTLCHTGSDTQGSCQYCHAVYGYNASGDILKTLNPYGKDYLAYGRNGAALETIASHDSDGDGFTNASEIASVRYPGDLKDDPTKVPAPYRIYTKAQLERLPQHSQFLLLNATKSTDIYAKYSGVTIEELLADAGALASATIVKVIAPDGFMQTHPLDPAATGYPVYGVYPPAVFHYDPQADVGVSPAGWCDYSSPYVEGRESGEPIAVRHGLRLLLALKRDGAYLPAGVLTAQNKLDGEGPYRVVPPQRVPSPPDQRSTASNPGLPWPFDATVDHNAGFSTRSATIIKVEPLPEGTTDINVYEAGWPFVDQEKVIVYGAIDPLPTIREKLDALATFIRSIDRKNVNPGNAREILADKLRVVSRRLGRTSSAGEISKLERDVLPKVDGCAAGSAPDKNDWVTDCEDQGTVYWGVQEVLVLLAIEADPPPHRPHGHGGNGGCDRRH